MTVKLASSALRETLLCRRRARKLRVPRRTRLRCFERSITRTAPRAAAADGEVVAPDNLEPAWLHAATSIAVELRRLDAEDSAKPELKGKPLWVSIVNARLTRLSSARSWFAGVRTLPVLTEHAVDLKYGLEVLSFVYARSATASELAVWRTELQDYHAEVLSTPRMMHQFHVQRLPRRLPTQ